MAARIDTQNRAFWNELCGTTFARSIGVVDDSYESLKRFDDWYFGFYPYLNKEIPFSELSQKNVLEVGLGYGTVGQRLIEMGSNYFGLDIAQGPVQMMRHRSKLIEHTAHVVQASILDNPFGDQTFDAIVAIGSYHHTGDLQGALDQSFRILKPGGIAYIMVYNAYSYRRFLYSPQKVLQQYFWETFRIGKLPTISEIERGQYDSSTEGAAAPHTVFTSPLDVKKICSKWSSVTVRKHNIAREGPFIGIKRDTALRYFGGKLGLDLYATLVK